MFARLIDFLLCRFASFITGVRPQAAIAEQSSEGHRVYFYYKMYQLQAGMLNK